MIRSAEAAAPRERQVGIMGLVETPHLDDIAAAPRAAKSIDANGDAAIAPVELVDRGDGVLTRLRLERGDHCIFQIEEDGVGQPLCGFLHKARRGSRDGEY